MDNKERLLEKLTNYNKSIERLNEALGRDESDDLVLDAVIQRFEFTYELFWKLWKYYNILNRLRETIAGEMAR
jgi:hypothetical protein